MDDYQKWQEAALGIEQDIEYVKYALPEGEIEPLRVALAVYRKNAETGVPWPNPDDLYCIKTRDRGQPMQSFIDMRRDFKTVC